MDIEERRLKELAWLYFYFRKNHSSIRIQALYNELKKAKLDIDKYDIVRDIEFLRDEGYIDATDTLWSQQKDDDEKLPGLRIKDISSDGEKLIIDPFSYHNSISTINTGNITVNTIQGNNNVSNISQSISELSDEKIEQIEKQIDKIQASLEINNTESKKYFDDLKEQLRQKNRKGIENGIKAILKFGISTISNINTVVSFISAIHGLSRLL